MGRLIDEVRATEAEAKKENEQKRLEEEAEERHERERLNAELIKSVVDRLPYFLRRAARQDLTQLTVKIPDRPDIIGEIVSAIKSWCGEQGFLCGELYQHPVYEKIDDDEINPFDSGSWEPRLLYTDNYVTISWPNKPSGK